MKKYVIVLIMLFLQGCKYPFPHEAEKLAEAADSAFVSHGVCSSIEDCRRKHYVYRGGTDENAKVILVRSGEYSSEVIADVVRVCFDFIENSQITKNITLEVYQEGIEYAEWFSGAKPHVVLVINK